MSGKREVRVRIGKLLKWTGLGLGIAFLALVIWSFWLWRFFAPPDPNPPVENPKYSRSDCIVRTDVAYPDGLSNDEMELVAADITEIITREIVRKGFPIASHGFTSPNLHAHHTQFTQRCDKKHEMVSELIDAYQSKRPEGGTLTVSAEPVTPSIDTILMRGDWWTDGREPTERHHD